MARKKKQPLSRPLTVLSLFLTPFLGLGMAAILVSPLFWLKKMEPGKTTLLMVFAFEAFFGYITLLLSLWAFNRVIPSFMAMMAEREAVPFDDQDEAYSTSNKLKRKLKELEQLEKEAALRVAEETPAPAVHVEEPQGIAAAAPPPEAVGHPRAEQKPMPEPPIPDSTVPEVEPAPLPEEPPVAAAPVSAWEPEPPRQPSPAAADPFPPKVAVPPRPSPRPKPRIKPGASWDDLPESMIPPT